MILSLVWSSRFIISRALLQSYEAHIRVEVDTVTSLCSFSCCAHLVDTSIMPDGSIACWPTEKAVNGRVATRKHRTSTGGIPANTLMLARKTFWTA